VAREAERDRKEAQPHRKTPHRKKAQGQGSSITVANGILAGHGGDKVRFPIFYLH
jgi:hypothetical protein